MVCQSEIETLLQKYSQEHVLKYWNELSEEEQEHFSAQLKTIDFEYVDQLYKAAMEDMNSTQVCNTSLFLVVHNGTTKGP